MATSKVPLVFGRLPLSNQVGSKVSRNFFSCQARPIFGDRLPRSLFRSIKQNIRWSSISVNALESPSEVFRHVSKPNASFTASLQSQKSAFFPETSSKSVGYWLLASAASVFGIVVFGGLTRLTESG